MSCPAPRIDNRTEIMTRAERLGLKQLKGASHHTCPDESECLSERSSGGEEDKQNGVSCVYTTFLCDRLAERGESRVGRTSADDIHPTTMQPRRLDSTVATSTAGRDGAGSLVCGKWRPSSCRLPTPWVLTGACRGALARIACKGAGSGGWAIACV